MSSPLLRRRIRLEAFKRDLSISEYVGEILDKLVPQEETAQKGHPVTREAVEELRRLREEILQNHQGQPFKIPQK